MKKIIRQQSIIGRKGGAQTAPTPINEDNTLRSRSYARVLDLLGWGEWEGLVDGAKSIFLDDTPLVSTVGASDISNFDGLSWTFQKGAQTQDYIAGFDSVENSVNVGVKIRAAAPVVRSSINSVLDKFIIGFHIPRLYEQKANGDVVRASISVKISISLNGGAYTDVRTMSWYDKCVSDYIETCEFNPPRSATPDTDRWDIKLTRLTPDHDGSTTLVDEIFWDTYSEVVSQKLSYPNMVLSGIEADAASFGKLPSRSWDVKMKKLQVPVNYDPIARTYSGNWDGTFKIAWSDNPAWAFYDLISNTSYGLGNYINTVFIDKWTLYEISQYCDVQVPDGNGGTEPRFSCNVFIQTQGEALKMLSDFASIFRGILYYFNGRVVPVQDRPRSAFHIFTKANVKGGLFNYTSTGRRARKTCAMVRFLNKEDFYRPAWQPVEDYDGIIRYGYQESEVVAFGCTSRGQAYRFGRMLIETEKREGEGVTFRTGQEATLLRVGDIINVLDADRAQAQAGGRLIAGSTATSINLDRPFTLVAGQSYSLTLVMPKAVTDVQDVTDSSQTPSMRTAQIETQPVLLVLGSQTTLTISGGSFTSSPPAGTTWILNSSSLVPQSFRILSIKEMDKNEWEISGNNYSQGKYDETETDPNFNPPPIIQYPNTNKVLPVTDITATLRQVVRPDGVYQYMDVSWVNQDPYANRFRVSYSHDGGALSAIPETSIPFASFIVDVAGVYTIQVYAVQLANGAMSPPTQLIVNVGDVLPTNKITITGLELKGQATDTIFAGRDAVFVWRMNSPAYAEELGQEEFGATADKVDPNFSHFRVMFFSGTVKLFEDICTDPTYTFTFEKNAKSVGGPYRQFACVVFPVDTYNILGKPASLTVANLAPPLPDLIQIPLPNACNFKFSLPNDIDFKGYMVWLSALPSFVISDALLVYDGPDSQPTIPMTSGVQYYTIYAAYDAFSKTGLVYSGIVPTMALLPDFTPPAVPTNLALSSAEVQNADGSSFATLTARWDANTEDDCVGYVVGIELTSAPGDWIFNTVSGKENSLFQWNVRAGVQYDVKVSAYDKDNNYSAYCVTVTLGVARDTTPPAAPVWSICSSAFRQFALSWTLTPVPADLDAYELWQATSDVSGSVQTNAIKLRDLYATATQIQFPLVGDLSATTTYYYWLRAYDTSGNFSAFSAVQAMTLPAIVAPAGLSATTGVLTDTDGTQKIFIDVSWTNSSTAEVANYLVEIATTAGGNNFNRAVVNQTKARFFVNGNVIYFIRVRANDSDAGFSAWSPEISIIASRDTVAPAAPTSVTISSAIKSIFLSWTNPTDLDYDRTNIYRATTNSFPGGTPYARISSNSYVDSAVTQGTTYYYWLKSEDTSGNETASPTTSVNTTPGTVQTSDIASFAVDLTKQYNATIALAGAVWTDNSPGAGQIAWNAHTLYWQGTAYSIAAGNTSNGYIVFAPLVSATNYQSSSPLPGLTDTQFIVATNVGGVHDLAWNAMANALIGTAYIANLAVTNAKINDLAVDKLTAGTISSQAINVSGGTSGYIQGNYVAGTSGWRIDGAGTLYAMNAVIKGGVTVGTPGSAGLFLGSDKMGYFDGTTWKSYIDSSGNMKLGTKLDWNNGTGVLTLSGYIVVGGAAGDVNGNATTISGSKITASTIDVTQLVASLVTTKEIVLSTSGTIRSTSATAIGTGNGIWMTQGASVSEFRFGNPSGQFIKWDGTNLTIAGSINIASLTSLATVATTGDFASLGGATKPANNATVGAVFGTNLSGGPFNTPSGAGLFIDATHLGYYNGSVWKTYMDNSGNFYLGGTSGSLQWNGSSLLISGTIDVGSGINRCYIDGTTISRGMLGQNRAEMYANGSNYTAFRSYNWDGSNSYLVATMGSELQAGYGTIRLSTAGGTETFFADGNSGRLVLAESIRTALGSTGSVPYTFTGRTGDGMYSYAAGGIGFSLASQAMAQLENYSESVSLTLGYGRTTSNYAYIDLVGDTTYTDCGLRLMRENGGANTNSQIAHRGTGDLNIIAVDSPGRIIFYAGAGAQLVITPSGVTIAGWGSMGQRNVTIQSGGSPSGGADGDVFFIY